jgi:hypothetical protein
MEIMDIAEQLEFQADWRRGKAEEFPDDRRNLEAAENPERLAKEIAGLGKSDTAQCIGKLWEMALEKEYIPYRAHE